jgi:hypothetical protein
LNKNTLRISPAEDNFIFDGNKGFISNSVLNREIMA